MSKQKIGTDTKTISSPYDQTKSIGHSINAQADDLELALSTACAAHASWAQTAVEQRASCLEQAAVLLEQRQADFMALAIREAGKTIPDAVAEIREAVDFLRYYANQAREKLAQPQIFAGPTGEHNQLSLHGRGTLLCISPWNFPLAIFLGQVSAGFG